MLASPRLQRNRFRAVSATFGAILAAGIVLFLIPAPSYTTTEGVVWLPENAIVRAGTDGFVRALLVEPGRIVTAGEALVESEEPTLKAELEILRARVAELETRLATERFTDRVRAEITTTELGQARAELATATDRAERLIVRSQSDGTFAVMKPQDLPGRFLREGQQIGYVLAAGSRIVRATIRQDDIDLVRHRLRSAEVKLAERLDEILPAEIIREVPAGRDDLPSKALGGAGGGALAVDPGDPHGTKTLQRVFQVDIELPGNAAAAAAFGSRAYVRFDHDWEPAGQQIWRRRAAAAAFPATGLRYAYVALAPPTTDHRFRLSVRRTRPMRSGPPARRAGSMPPCSAPGAAISPYVLSALSRTRLERFARRVEDLEPQLVTLPDWRLRELCGRAARTNAVGEPPLA